MSKLGQLRKRVGYETNTPRCETCREYRKPYVYLTTHSITKRAEPFCKRHDFTVRPLACCDEWTDAHGVTLFQSGLK